MSFQAKIKLGNMKRAPLTHEGFRGRRVKKGESFRTTNPEEAAYYQSQPGFGVIVEKGKLASAAKPKRARKSAPEPEVDEEEVDEDEEDDEEEEPDDGEVSEAYTKADLKKMKPEELKKLIDGDDDLPLALSDLPKRATKKEIIEAILEAQAGDEEDDEEEDDED